MSSRCREPALVRALRRCLAAGSPARRAGLAAARELRVCADPNNLPFSNDAGEGLREPDRRRSSPQDLGATLDYTWWAQRARLRPQHAECRRSAMSCSACRRACEHAAHDARPTTARPTSSSRARRRGRDSARSTIRGCATLTIGVQLIGDDGANTPPAHALAGAASSTTSRLSRSMATTRSRARRRASSTRSPTARSTSRSSGGRSPATSRRGRAAAGDRRRCRPSATAATCR